MISEQRYPGLFNNRQAFVAFVIDDVDCDPGDLRRSRTGSSQYAINEPEADAIVRQIEACIADPRYAGKTMGVISLQGEAQAKLIERKLLETLEPEWIEQRRLICGDA